jgi:exodeoxyribonuclease VII small subunit
MIRLSEIINALERNDTNLETSIQLFEEGLELVKSCDGQLKEFENKVQELMLKYAGEAKNE